MWHCHNTVCCVLYLGCFEKLQMDGRGPGCWTKRAGRCDHHQCRGTSNPLQCGPYSWSQVGKRASPLMIPWRRKPSEPVQRRSPCLSGTPFVWSEKGNLYTHTHTYIYIYIYIYIYTHTILPKVLGRPLLMNRFDYFSNFYEYKS